MGKSIVKKVTTGLRKAGEFAEDVGEVMQDTSKYVVKGGKVVRSAGTAIGSAAGVAAATGQEEIAVPLATLSAGAIVAGETAIVAGKLSKKIGQGVEKVGGTVAHYTGNMFKKDIDKKHYDHWDVSHQAYSDDKTLEGFTLDEELSKHRKVDVWKKNGTNQIFVGYQGSQFGFTQAGYEDTVADAHIFRDTMKKSQMFKEVAEITDQIFDKYGDTHEIHAAAHSLGGMLLEEATCDHQFTSAVSFNKGTTPWHTKCEGKDAQSSMVNYTSGLDPISAGTMLPHYRKEKTYIVRRKTPHLGSKYNTHTDEIFRPQRR